VPYYLLTVESSERTDLGLQVKPTVRIIELASRVGEFDVPMPGDKLLLLYPDTGTWQAPVAQFGVEAWSRDGITYSHSDPSDPQYTLAIGGRGGPDEIPVGTEIWLDDVPPTSGHRTNGWTRIIEDIKAQPWQRIDPEDSTPPHLDH
jgi:hypothetical protein